MFELMIALLLASSCPTTKTVNGHSQSCKHLVAAIDTSGDLGHIPPGLYGRKHLPIPGRLAVAKDTSGDLGHIPPGPSGRKRLPIPRTTAAANDTSGDLGHIPPNVFFGKHVIKA